MTTLDDTSLAGRCADGDENAWRELMKRYGDLVFAVCFRVLADRAEARDAAQETLVRAVKSISGFRKGGRLKPWLTKIAWNVALRKVARRSVVPFAGGAPLENDLPSTLPDPLQVAEQREMKTRLAEAVEKLCPQERVILELRLGQDMDYREIAEAVSLPIGTVKTHLFRARQRVIGECVKQRRGDELSRRKPVASVG